MADPVFTFRNSDDTADVTSLSFTPENGVQTAEQEILLYNDRGGTFGSDTATELVLACKTRTTGATAFSLTHEAAAYGWVIARAIDQGGPGSPIAQATTETPIGASRELLLRDLPSDGYRRIGVSVLVPAGVGSKSFEILLIPRARSVSESLPDGTIARGIRSLVDDPSGSYILSGGEITGTGTDEVSLGETEWMFEGVPYHLLGADLTLNQTDGNSATLASGEEMIVAVTLEAGSAVATKGAKAASGLAVAPATGPNRIAEILVDYQGGGTSVIDNADIDQTMLTFGCFEVEFDPASPTVTVHPGEAFFAQRRVRTTGKRSVTFPLASTGALWITPAGAFVAGAETTPPVLGALPIRVVVTDGSGVTSCVRVANYAEPLVRLSAQIVGTLSASQVSVPVLYSARKTGRVMLGGGLLFSLGTLGGTSGKTVVDVEVLEPGSGSWTSLFPSSGTTDIRPEIAYNATLRYAYATPETVSIAPGSLVRFKVIQVPGTASADLYAELAVF